ncbi:MAG: NUDIX domain-containing protein [Alphaproteobacteria bacterium]|nr:NUDIX domain-containing protein [Alphaproteobacteria bacterium]
MPSPPPTGIEIIEKTTPFKGYFRIDRYVLKHRTFAGGWTTPMSREVFERGHAAAVLLYDPTRCEFVMCEQFRVGAMAGGLDPWMLEMVAGIIDPGEKPDEVCRREAVEEAGREVTDLWPIAHYGVSPGGTSETVYLYLGRVSSVGAGGVHGLAAEHEDIRVHVLTEAALRAILDAGKIQNAATLIAAQWFFLNRDKVRAAWSVPGGR